MVRSISSRMRTMHALTTSPVGQTVKPVSRTRYCVGQRLFGQATNARPTQGAVGQKAMLVGNRVR